MKTPIQDLMEMITKVENDALDKNMLLSVLKFMYLPKEKESIINSFNQGFRDGESETMVADTKKDVAEYDDAINYYNSTFSDSN
jgi:hypothetical protein